jgi:peptidyl-prolyl cis-trans isomerase C
MRHTFMKPALTTLACAAVALAACQPASRPGEAAVDFRHNRAGTGTPVATFHKDSITAEELTERFAEMNPFARARFQTVEERKQFVENMARFELLAAEALARGLQNDPEVVHQAKTVMVQKLLQKEFDEKPTPVSEADVAAFYQKHQGDYVKPEMVRLSHVFLKAEAGSADRAAKRKKAEALLAQARGLQPLDFNGFGRLASEESDEERTKPLRGDMRYLSNEDLAAQHGPEVLEASRALTQVGQVSEVVETPKGFHVLKLQARQAALNLGVEQVQAQIQRRLLQERRAENFNRFVDDLRKKAAYKLHDAPLAAMEIDMKAPAKEPRGPPPGYIPPMAGGPASH